VVACRIGGGFSRGGCKRCGRWKLENNRGDKEDEEDEEKEEDEEEEDEGHSYLNDHAGTT